MLPTRFQYLRKTNVQEKEDSIVNECNFLFYKYYKTKTCNKIAMLYCVRSFTEVLLNRQCSLFPLLEPECKDLLGFPFSNMQHIVFHVRNMGFARWIPAIFVDCPWTLIDKPNEELEPFEVEWQVCRH